MESRNNIPTGDVEVPTDYLLQVIGELTITTRIQGQRLNAVTGELKRVHDRLEEIAAMGLKAAEGEASDENTEAQE